MNRESNQITGANAGGASRLQIRAVRAARIAQFLRSPAMRIALSIIVSAVLLAVAVGCGERRAEQPVVPQGFKTSLLDILACPENLTPLHLATQREIDAVRERIRAGTLQYWSGTTVTDTFDGLLIRADGKIAYTIQRGVPVMLIEKALVLDDTVGKPHPDAHRKK